MTGQPMPGAGTDGRWTSIAMQLGLSVQELNDLLEEPSDRGSRIQDGMFRRALRVIDRSCVAARIETWNTEDAVAPGGRPALFEARSVLTAQVLLLMEGQAATFRRIGDVLIRRYTSEQRAILGLALPTSLGAGAAAQAARRVIQRVLAPINAWPMMTEDGRLTGNARHTKAEWMWVHDWRKQHKDLLDRREARAWELMNLLVEASIAELPAKFRSNTVSVAQDATFLAVAARSQRNDWSDYAAERKMSMESDARRYQRDEIGEDGVVFARKKGFGYEGEFMVLVSNDPARPDSVPHVILSAWVHVPSETAGGNARRMVDEIVERRGLTILDFIADRAYLPNGRVEDLQSRLWEIGARPVMDYPKQYLGDRPKDIDVRGAMMIEGWLYCHTMPRHLIDAKIDFLLTEAEIDDNAYLTGDDRKQAHADNLRTFREKVKARRDYAFRDNGGRKDNGAIQRMCPAQGSGCTAGCTFQKTGLSTGGRGLLQIFPKAGEQDRDVCGHAKSTTFTIADEGKTGQYYQYGSEEWAQHYGQRNVVESINRYVKDEASFGLGSTHRRRAHGRAMMLLYTGLTVVAANLELIRAWLLERVERLIESGTIDAAPNLRLRRSRHSSSAARIRAAIRTAVRQGREAGRDRRRRDPMLT